MGITQNVERAADSPEGTLDRRACQAQRAPNALVRALSPSKVWPGSSQARRHSRHLQQAHLSCC